jgi:uncharacterized protein YraI
MPRKISRRLGEFAVIATSVAALATALTPTGAAAAPADAVAPAGDARTIVASPVTATAGDARTAIPGAVTATSLASGPLQAAPRATVATVRTAGGALNERNGPSTANGVNGHLANGHRVAVRCHVYGQRVRGHVTTSANWEVLSDGRYVSDGYLAWSPRRPAVPWCGVSASHPAVAAIVHTGGGRLTVRSGASRAHGAVGSIGNGAALSVTCRVWGQAIAGAQTTTAAWDQLSSGRYVSDSYVRWSPTQPSMPWCGEAPLTLAPVSTTAFIRLSLASARSSRHTYHVPTSVTLAQAILESGSGKSTLTRVDHNYFGMKCFGNPGSIAVGCRLYATHECSKSSCFATTAMFRAYRSAADSYLDHGRLLATTARYKPAFKYVNDPNNFARALQKAGYATSPTYATNLIALMKRYNLYRYDVKL